MIWLPSRNLDTITRFVQSRFPAYKRVTTLYSTTFIAGSGLKIYVSDKWFGLKFLGLMSQIRARAKVWLKENPQVASLPECMRCFAFRKVSYNGQIYEYDLRSAYARTAYKLGILDKTLYRKIRKLPKSARLAAIGALGTRKQIEIYENGKLKQTIFTRAPTWPAWNAIVTETDKRMREIFARHKSVLFYWFDAVFATEQIALPRTQFKQRCVKGFYDAVERYTLTLADGRTWNLPIIQFYPESIPASIIEKLQTRSPAPLEPMLESVPTVTVAFTHV